MELIVQPYNRVYYKNCFYNPLLTGVYYCGGNDLPFLSNDFFRYVAVEHSALLLNTDNYRKRDEYELIRDMGIRLLPFEPNGDFIECLKDSIDGNTPIFMPIDNYYHTSPHYAEGYLSDHAPHYLLISGYDDQRRIAVAYDISNIYDGFACYREELQYADLEDAFYSYRELYGRHKALRMQQGDLNYAYLDIDAQAALFRENGLSCFDECEESLENILTVRAGYREQFERYMDDFDGDPQRTVLHFALTERANRIRNYQLEIFSLLTPELAELNEGIFNTLYQFHRVAFKMQLTRRYTPSIEPMLLAVYDQEKQFYRQFKKRLLESGCGRETKDARVTYLVHSRRWNLTATAMLTGRRSTLRFIGPREKELARLEIQKDENETALRLNGFNGEPLCARYAAGTAEDCRIDITGLSNGRLLAELTFQESGQPVKDSAYGEWEAPERQDRVERIEFLSEASTLDFSRIIVADYPEVLSLETLPAQAWLTPEGGWRFRNVQGRAVAMTDGANGPDDRRAFYVKETLCGSWSVEADLRLISGWNEEGRAAASLSFCNDVSQDVFRLSVQKLQGEYRFEIWEFHQEEWHVVELEGFNQWIPFEAETLRLVVTRLSDDTASLVIQADKGFYLERSYQNPEMNLVVHPAFFAYRTDATFENIRVWIDRLSPEKYVQGARAAADVFFARECRADLSSNWAELGLKALLNDGFGRYCQSADAPLPEWRTTRLWEPILKNDLNTLKRTDAGWSKALRICMAQWLTLQLTETPDDQAYEVYRWFMEVCEIFSNEEGREGLWIPIDDGHGNEKMSIESVVPLLLAQALAHRIPEKRAELDARMHSLVSGIDRYLGREDGGYWKECDYRGPLSKATPYGREAAPLWGNLLMAAFFFGFYREKGNPAFLERAHHLFAHGEYFHTEQGAYTDYKRTENACALEILSRVESPAYSLGRETILQTAAHILQRTKKTWSLPEMQILLSAGKSAGGPEPKERLENRQ